MQMKVVGGARGGHGEDEAAGDDDGESRARCGRIDIVDGAGNGNARVLKGTLC